MTLKIEKGIPLPHLNQPKYPIRELDVGDSFAVKVPHGEDPKVWRDRLIACGQYQKRLSGRRFSVRTVVTKNQTKIRVWRVA